MSPPPADRHESPDSAHAYAVVTGAVIELLRERAGYTRAHLARRAALQPRWIGSLERGEARAGLQEIAQLARAFEVEDEDLVRFVRDAWGRASRAARAAMDVSGPSWCEAVSRTTGSGGLRGLAASAHPTCQELSEHRRRLEGLAETLGIAPPW